MILAQVNKFRSLDQSSWIFWLLARGLAARGGRDPVSSPPPTLRTLQFVQQSSGLCVHAAGSVIAVSALSGWIQGCLIDCGKFIDILF